MLQIKNVKDWLVNKHNSGKVINKNQRCPMDVVLIWYLLVNLLVHTFFQQQMFIKKVEQFTQ